MTTPSTDPAPRWVAQVRDADWRCPAPPPQVRAFHRTLPGYAVTPLVELPGVAAELGVGRAFAKDESSRLGLPAFKALGASWAVDRALRERPEGAPPTTLVTATDGNHGRAVARFARRLGHAARIVVPSGVHPAAIAAIVDEGAQVEEVDGTYDDAVAEAARLARELDGVLVQDTSWEGYEEIPRAIVDGYATLFDEVDEQLRAAGVPRPDLVLVPVGVGSLAQACIGHYRSDAAAPGTALVTVEPVSAACALASIDAGRPVAVETGETLMAGLNCGTLSQTAWPALQRGVDGAVAVTDGDAAQACRDLAAGVAAGPCGGAGLAGLRAVLTGPGSDERRSHLRVGSASTVVLLVTEGIDANPSVADVTRDRAEPSAAAASG